MMVMGSTINMFGEIVKAVFMELIYTLAPIPTESTKEGLMILINKVYDNASKDGKVRTIVLSINSQVARVIQLIESQDIWQFPTNLNVVYQITAVEGLINEYN